jgi:hypothetical protein
MYESENHDYQSILFRNSNKFMSIYLKIRHIFGINQSLQKSEKTSFCNN